MSINHSSEVLDIVAAADLLGITPFALRRWKSKGIGPQYFQCGRLIRYEREAILSWIKSQTVKTRITAA
jgi:hypothetical protein